MTRLSQLLRLLRFDALHLLRERLALGVLLAGVLACGLATITGIAWQRHLAHEYTSLQNEARSVSEHNRSRWADSANHDERDRLFLPMLYRDTIALPPARLPDFSRGRSTVEPTGARVRLMHRPDTIFSRYQVDNPESLARGALDLGWVALIVAPLLLIALGYGVFISDCDSGTARLWLAQAGTPLKLLAARSINRLALVGIPITLAAVTLWLTGPNGRTASITAWLGIAMLALLLWWATILLVNSFRVGAETAALVLVGLWTLQVFAAPTVIAAATALRHPLPSRFEAVAAARATKLHAEQAWEKEHPEQSLQGSPAAMNSYESRRGWVFQYTHVRQQIAAALEPFNAQMEQQMKRQQQWSNRLALLAAPLLAADAMTAIAQTDQVTYSARRQAAVDWLQARNSYLTDLIVNSRPVNVQAFDAIPRFIPSLLPAPPLAGVLWLGLLTLVTGGIALWRLGRMKGL